MEMTLVTDRGLHARSVGYAYNWSCGPHKFTCDVEMSRNEALIWARRIGGKVKLHVRGAVVWYGFLSEINLPTLSVKVTDIYNHLLSEDGEVITSTESVESHGLLSTKLSTGISDEDISILSMPVIRGNINNLNFDNTKVKATILGEGPLNRLNRVIYVNNDKVVANSGGQVRLGGAEADTWVQQHSIVLPFPSNFVSTSYTVDGATGTALIEVIDNSNAVLASETVYAGSQYVSIRFPTIPAGTQYSVRITYGGAGAYVISLGSNYYLGQSTTSSLTNGDPVSINIRYEGTMSEIATNVNNYQGLVTLDGDDSVSFVDSSFQKLGDYITNAVIGGQGGLVFEEAGFTYKMNMTGNDPYTAPSIGGGGCWDHLAPMFQRRSCLNYQNISQINGFLVSNWYGTATYKYRSGKGDLSFS